MIQETPAPLEVDEKIQVAPWPGLAPCDRTDQPDITGSVALCEIKHLGALCLESFADAHRSSIAAVRP